MKIDFKHKPAAHCENGVTSNLLDFHGISLSEPMVFGIGSGIFFSYLSFIKVNKIPVISFRPWPGMIFKRVTKRLGIKTARRKFSSTDQAMKELDNLLEQGIPVGMLVGVYYLPYFPPEFRFHFNAHNIVVFGKENGKYLVSDPVMENVETLTYDELVKVRFAKGTYPPKGRMYYITEMPAEADIKKAIVKGIVHAGKNMATIPVPIFGAKGIRHLAKKMRTWPEKLGKKMARLYIGQLIRMLEEIGTGGAGFRFIYAAFLQEAASYLNEDSLKEFSTEMTSTGDQWREFALQASRNFKQRGKNITTFDELADLLVKLSEREQNIFQRLLDRFSKKTLM